MCDDADGIKFGPLKEEHQLRHPPEQMIVDTRQLVRVMRILERAIGHTANDQHAFLVSGLVDVCHNITTRATCGDMMGTRAIRFDECEGEPRQDAEAIRKFADHLAAKLGANNVLRVDITGNTLRRTNDIINDSLGGTPRG